MILWMNGILKTKWGRGTRERICLRKIREVEERWKREEAPYEREETKLMDAVDAIMPTITFEDIKNAFIRGDEVGGLSR
jgi:hypothetical protein